jgi:hypothetical protein
MKYMLMIYHNPDAWNALSADEQQRIPAEGGRLWAELVANGEGIFAEPLGDFARYVTVRNGLTDITDGPYAEAKEQIVGILLIDVASADRALEIAASWPDATVTGIEVRSLGNYNPNIFD